MALKAYNFIDFRSKNSLSLVVLDDCMISLKEKNDCAKNHASYLNVAKVWSMVIVNDELI